MKEFICIECPKGCNLHVDDDLNVTGNSCLRGKKYAINEVTCPKRVVTSTVCIDSKEVCRLPVKTSMEIPKDKMFDLIKILDNVKVSAPIKCGDVIIKNACGTGVDVVATRTIEK